VTRCFCLLCAEFLADAFEELHRREVALEEQRSRIQEADKRRRQDSFKGGPASKRREDGQEVLQKELTDTKSQLSAALVYIRWFSWRDLTVYDRLASTVTEI
jgi:hypothetical protein